VIDALECEESHQVEIHWHCHEDAEVSLLETEVMVARANGKLSLQMEDKRFLVRLVYGDEDPPLGWISRSFDSKLPCAVVVWSGEIKGTCKLETRMQVILDKESRSVVSGKHDAG
jgi:hypothetical protein